MCEIDKKVIVKIYIVTVKEKKLFRINAVLFNFLFNEFWKKYH